MRLGLIVTEYDVEGGTPAIGPSVADLARRAEAVGFASFWATDHLFQAEWGESGRSASDPMLDAYGVLNFVAGLTERMTLGAMVSPVGFRQPGLLAKMVTTLDVLSGGRAMLGLGAGWYEREHVGLGLPFPPLAERFERLEETLRIVHQMWSDDDGPFAGTHFQLAETLNRPQPISRSHPPILVGGAGERKTLRLVAQYADACNLYPTPDLPHKLDVLREHCEASGRVYDAIEKTVQLHAPVSADGAGETQSPDEFLDTLHNMAGLGIDHAVLIIPGMHRPGLLELFGERIVPEATRIAVAGRLAADHGDRSPD